MQPIRTFVPIIQEGKSLDFCVGNIIRFKFLLTITDDVIKIRFLISYRLKLDSSKNFFKDQGRRDSIFAQCFM